MSGSITPVQGSAHWLSRVQGSAHWLSRTQGSAHWLLASHLFLLWIISNHYKKNVGINKQTSQLLYSSFSGCYLQRIHMQKTISVSTCLVRIYSVHVGGGGGRGGGGVVALSRNKSTRRGREREYFFIYVICPDHWYVRMFWHNQTSLLCSRLF